MNWRNFRIKVSGGCFLLSFPCCPNDEQGKNLTSRLHELGWDRDGLNHWYKRESDEWRSHCQGLIDYFAEFGAAWESETPKPKQDDAWEAPKPQTSDLSKVMEKIKKLLALTNNPNEAEATAAAAKAQSLLLQYNLSIADLADDAQEVLTEETVWQSVKTVSWKFRLLDGIAQANCCFCFSNATRARGKQTGVGLNIIGKPSNILVCTQMFEYLTQAVERLANQAEGDRAFKNAFRLGCAARLKQRLMEQVREQCADGIAATSDTSFVSAIVVKSAYEKASLELSAYQKEHYPRMGSTGGGSYSSRSGYASGSAAGNSIGLNKQVGSGNKQLRGGR